MKKRILLVSVLVICVFIVVGCSSRNNKSENTSGDVKLPKSDEFDYVLVSGDGYHLVLKVNGKQDMLGIVDDNAKFICPLTEQHVFIDGNQAHRGRQTVDRDGNATEKMRVDDIRTAMHYAGDGMFACHTYDDGGGNSHWALFNVKLNIGFDIGTFEWPSRITSYVQTAYGGYPSEYDKFNEGFLTGRSGKRGSNPYIIISVDGGVYFYYPPQEGGEIELSPHENGFSSSEGMQSAKQYLSKKYP